MSDPIRKTDLQGRPYATVRATKAGSIVIADGGFTCICKGAKLTVKTAADGDLYVDCDEGQHSLSGQREGSVYIGLYSAPPGDPADAGLVARPTAIGATNGAF